MQVRAPPGPPCRIKTTLQPVRAHAALLITGAAWPELCVGGAHTMRRLSERENSYSYEALATGPPRADPARGQLAEPGGQLQVAGLRQRSPQPDADFAEADDAARPARAACVHSEWQ